MNKPILIGHRGGRFFGGVENTEDALECDIRVTNDNVIIVYHDESLERLTHNSEQKYNIEIENSSWQLLKNVQLSQNYDNKTYFGKICLLEKYLQLCKLGNIKPVIELKWTKGIYASNMNPQNADLSNLDLLMKLIQKFELINDVIIISSMRGCLEYLRGKYPNMDLQWICKVETNEMYEWCFKNFISLDIFYEACRKEIVNSFHQKDLKVNIWTLNDQTKLKDFIQMGVDMITTDYLFMK